MPSFYLSIDQNQLSQDDSIHITISDEPTMSVTTKSGLTYTVLLKNSNKADGTKANGVTTTDDSTGIVTSPHALSDQDGFQASQSSASGGSTNSVSSAQAFGPQHATLNQDLPCKDTDRQ